MKNMPPFEKATQPLEEIQYGIESQIEYIEMMIQTLVQLFWRKGKIIEKKLNEVVDLLEGGPPLLFATG